MDTKNVSVYSLHHILPHIYKKNVVDLKYTGAMGYQNSKTTEIYTHFGNKDLNPLDLILKKEGKK